LSYPGKLGPRYHPRPPAAAHRELLVLPPGTSAPFGDAKVFAETIVQERQSGRTLPVMALVAEVIAQLTAAKGLAQLGEAFGLDLAYAFACHAEGLAHFLQGMSLAVLETKA